MPMSHSNRMMKTMFLRGLLWLYYLCFGYMALALEPGYLDFDNLPDTNFTCVGKVIGGYYADLETNCQMFHVCTIGQLDEPMDIRFLCLNGTVFDQETRVCERIDEVDCSKSEQFYSLNLELYGNTQPPIGEESPETDLPIVIKPTATTTTTTTTTTERPKPKTTKIRFFTTSLPPPPVTTSVSKVISTHHFPITDQSPDIRFNPEEINISLNPGAGPSIRQKPISFQQQIFANTNSDNVNAHNHKKAIETTHTNFDSDRDIRVQVQKPKIPSTTQKPQKSVVNYGLIHDNNHDQQQITPSDINYGFTYHHSNEDEQYHTEIPHPSYQYHHQFRPELSQHFRNTHFRSTTYRSELVPTTRKNIYTQNEGVTTYRSPFLSTLKPSQSYQFRTEKPHKIQLPLPFLPNLSFSSPAPFSLTRHIDTKRYTHDHIPPPRIIISASASVSDASGRRLNYSLGTIGVAPSLEQPPKSYDDYKDHDVGLDPFYYDVPKVVNVRHVRKRRSAKQPKHSDVIRNDQEAIDVLKFLFDWYKSQEKTTTETLAVQPGDITEINEKLSNEHTSESSSRKEEQNYGLSNLFKRGSKFNIVGDVLSATESELNDTVIDSPSTPTNVSDYEYEYVDDNYEPLAYDDKYNDTLQHVNNGETSKNDTVQDEDTPNKESWEDGPPEELEKNLTTAKVDTRVETAISDPNNDRDDGSIVHGFPKELEENSTIDEYDYVEDEEIELRTLRPSQIEVPEASETPVGELKNSLYSTGKLIEEDTEVTTSSPQIESQTEHEVVNFSTLLSQVIGESVLPYLTTRAPEIITSTATDLLEKIVDVTSPDKNMSKLEEIPVEMEKTDIVSHEPTIRPLEEVIVILVKDPTRKHSATRQSRLKFVKDSNTTKNHEENEENYTVTPATTPVERNESSAASTTEEIHTSNEANINEMLTDSAIPTTTLFNSVLDHNSDSTVVSLPTIPLEEFTTEMYKATTLNSEDDTGTTHLVDENSEVYQSSTTTTSATEFPLRIENLTPVEVRTEEIMTTTTGRPSRRGYSRRTRPPNYRRYKPTNRHRFSTSNLTQRPHRRKYTVEDDIIETISDHSTSTTSTTTEPTVTMDKEDETTTIQAVLSDDHDNNKIEEIPSATDAPLYKSANPTQAETTSRVESFQTTPLSSLFKVRRAKVGKAWVFNCFDKEINKFYSDPRDCRLFHYCTPGYTKNQLLDMKFVCDQNTYFDDERLVCSYTKPMRCL